jgi:UDP-N-acetylglucosamine 2-epimerase (non-hydrolysing)/GDP/UDP-N,N'-diacetylbacillosamine 2-epimerase (hydrolysing)
MKYVAAVAGNSSSGLLEAPSFGIPSLDIGDRQNGRIASESVFHCNSDKTSILNGLEQVLSQSFRKKAQTVHNPYEKKNTAKDIFQIISTFPLENLNQKHFYDYSY